MFEQHDRRSFLGAGLGGLVAMGARSPFGGTSEPAATFPKQDAESVQEMVRVAHADIARVRQLVDARPALAKAAVDWGFGDWEDALGAASHTGRADIAEVLLAHGARPTLFSATMLGHLDVVKGFVERSPGCQRILGPHSITLLAHARAGGANARPVRDYLEKLGDADAGPPVVDLPEADRATYAGTYAFGPSATDRLEITSDKNGLSIGHPGLAFPRGLKFLGNGEFFPIGAESVRIRFTISNGRASGVRVYDPDVVVSGTRA